MYLRLASMLSHLRPRELYRDLISEEAQVDTRSHSGRLWCVEMPRSGQRCAHIQYKRRKQTDRLIQYGTKYGILHKE